MFVFPQRLLRWLSSFLCLLLSLFIFMPKASARTATWPFDIASKYAFDLVDIEIAGGQAGLVQTSYSDDSAESFGGGTGFGALWDENQDGLVLQTQTNLWELPDNAIPDEWCSMSENALLIHLNEEGAKDKTVIIDYSGNANNGELRTKGSTDEKSIEGKLRGALNFEGMSSSVNDLIVGPATNQIIGDNCQQVTMALWLRSTSDNRGYVASLKATTGNSTLLSLTINSNKSIQGAGRLGFLTRNKLDNAHKYIDHFGNYNDGKWHHLAAVVDGDERILYIDGERISSDEDGIASKTGNTGLFTIGGFASNYGNLQYSGAVDEVAIWKRALSEDEIAKIYRMQRSDLSGYFDSRVMDSKGEGGWSDIAWAPKRPYGKELPNSNSSDSGYAQGDINMQGNLALFHMNGSVGTIGDGDVIPNTSEGKAVGKVVGDPSIIKGGVYKEAIEFTDNGFVDIEDLSVSLDSDIKSTVEFWFNWKGLDSTAFGWSEAYGLDLRHGCIGFKVGDSIFGVNSESYVGGWHHLAAVFSNSEVSGEKVKLYLDGSDQALGSCYSTVPTSKYSVATTARIGGLPHSNSVNFRGGLIDEFAIYNRELSASEIHSRYLRGIADIKFQVRTCEMADCQSEGFIGPDGTDESYYSELVNHDGSLPEITFNNLQIDRRYLQYRAFLTSELQSELPMVNSVSIGPGSYPTSNPTISNLSPAPKYSTILSFVETLGVDNSGTIKYQISNDGTTWYFYDGAEWSEASDYDQTNIASEINENLELFMEDVGIGRFHFKAYLHSDSVLDAVLDSIVVEYELKGAAILILESGGSTQVSDNGTNDKYSVVLNREPQANVTVMLSVNDDVVVDPQYLVFTPNDWAEPQEVTVSAVASENGEGPASVTLGHTVVSEDPGCDGLEVTDVVIKVKRAQAAESPPIDEVAQPSPSDETQDDSESAGGNEADSAESGPSSSCSLIVR
ncbi:MAG: LamG domain-containing protein [Deltaproteobacteria bacterium]|nr:LamG domain-containing protein [Deltaproteobacteria bacterium]